MWNRCPSATRLAAFADRTLDEPERHVVEAHVAGCETCLETLAALTRGSDEAPKIPPALLARARAIGDRPARTLVPRWAPALAAVAAVAVAIVLLPRDPSSRPAAPSSTAARDVRSTGEVVVAPTVTAPMDEAVIPAGPIRVQWNASAGAAFYQIRLAGEDGALVWEGRADRSADNQTINAALAPGRRYYVTVIAHSEGERTVRSRAVGFTVEGRPR
jgi:hypothetical protein